jgi:uncharacterized protein YbaP (TraB family)
MLVFFKISYSTNAAPYWELETDKCKMYLLGSIHMAKADIYPLDSAIEKAFERSDYLITEIDMDEAANPELLKDLRYPKGDSLEAHIDDTTMVKLTKYMKTKGMSPQFFNKLKPSALMMLVTTMEYGKAGLSPEFGIEKYFMNKIGSKTLMPLETAESQLKVLGKMDEDENYFLNSTLDNIDSISIVADSLLKLWVAGDGDKLLELIYKEDDISGNKQKSAEFKDALLKDRNIEMNKKIGAFVKDGGTYFVIVGAAHLLGPDGIIEYLKQQGYTLKKK